MLEYLAWYAVQVHTRHEKQASQILIEKGYEIFRPMYVKRKSHPRVFCEAPLFPGYLFCRVASKVMGKIVTTPGVLRIVSNGNTPARVDESEINRVRQITESDLARTPWRYLPSGCRVRIESGPLSGLEGFLEQDGEGSKLVVSITMLCRSVAAVLESSTIVTPLTGKSMSRVMRDEERLALKLVASI